MMTASDMTGEAALVTGAASGLGRATALQLARAGCDLALVDVNAAGLAETEAALAAHGVQVLVLPADLTDPHACAQAVADTVTRFGRLDALCNVAGLIYFANSAEMAVADFQRSLAVNLAAPFLLSRAALPHLLQTHGAIVNVASSAAFIGEAYAAAYCASKAGLVGLTKAMAMEFIKQPIRINAVAPGGMMTNIGVNIRMPPGADLELIRRFSGLRGLVEVEEVAAMVAHLASDAGRAFHGACVTMDAGITAG